MESEVSSYRNFHWTHLFVPLLLRLTMTMLPAANVIRDTPGRLLLTWAILFAFLVLLSWRVHVHHADYDWLEYPTALGDNDWYDPAPGKGLGGNDFFEPNLRFTAEGRPQVLFRHLHQPTTRRDVTMRKVAREESGRHFVYVEEKPADSGTRFFLKVEEDRYIEFGERLFYPSFEQTRR